jgi:hypothetical protein
VKPCESDRGVPGNTLRLNAPILQVASGNAGIRFVALDNGGTWEGESALRKCLGFTRLEELQAALGLADRPYCWMSPQARFAALVAHIEALGPGKYFAEL